MDTLPFRALDSGIRHTVADCQEVQKRLASLNIERNPHAVDALKSLSITAARTLPRAQAQHVDAVAALSARFPHFSDAIDKLARSLQLRAVLDEPVGFDPLLMVGPPGVGKTRFLTELAGAVPLGIAHHSAADASSGFLLSGVSVKWEDGSPGWVAKLLTDEKKLGTSPLMFIDELDKAGVDRRYPLYPRLLGLLEPESACRYQDEALEIDMDTRCISWVFAANAVSPIPVELLSRLDIVRVDLPRPEHMPGIVRSIDHDIRDAAPRMNDIFEKLDYELIEHLAALSPREVRRALKSSYATAARRVTSAKRVALSVFDLPEAARARHGSPGMKSTAARL